MHTKIKLLRPFSSAEAINYYKVLTEETIQGRKLYKGGNYMRKYGKSKVRGKISQNFVAFSEYMNFKRNMPRCFLPAV